MWIQSFWIPATYLFFIFLENQIELNSVLNYRKIRENTAKYVSKIESNLIFFLFFSHIKESLEFYI